MGDVIGLPLSVALPWIAGTLWTRAVLNRESGGGLLLSVGYGYLIGMTAVTLLLRLLDAIGVRWSLLWVVLPMAALACAAFVRPAFAQSDGRCS